MIIFTAAMIGAIVGGMIAKKRGGKMLDVVQYVGIYALAFGLVGLVVTLLVHRLAV